MKKFSLALLSVAIVFSFAACIYVPTATDGQTAAVTTVETALETMVVTEAETTFETTIATVITTTVSIEDGPSVASEFNLPNDEASFVSSVANALISTVSIEVTIAGGGKAFGSGIVWSSGGFIVTNNHVVSGARGITARFADGRSYTAAIWATSVSDDLCVLKIEPKSGEAFVPVTVCTAEPIIGQTCFAIGNTVGSYPDSVTRGVVSALYRNVEFEGARLRGALQFDAPISRGNSGGGLFNSAGQLIGIVTAKSANSEAPQVGFAIRTATVITVVTALVAEGY